MTRHAAYILVAALIVIVYLSLTTKGIYAI
jgi:hypothetical protein